MSQPVEVPVLIVGAGPAGLTAAITLAQHGVDVLMVERRQELSGLPRATAISTRSMELFRSFGLELEIRARELDVSWLALLTQTMATASAGMAIPLGFPSREQSAVVSPTAPASVPQDDLEPILMRHLRSLPTARVQMGVEVVGVAEVPEGIQVEMRNLTTGASHDVHADYVIAADGAHSAVRRALGISMQGPENLRNSVTAIFRAPLWDVVGDARHGIYMIGHPKVPGVFVPAGRGDRWAFAVDWDPQQERRSDYTEQRLTELIRLGAGLPDIEPRFERIGTFTFAAQLADRFRQGTVFLIGDAAHRVTPRGGTGMNTAIYDGYDVGWKLSWVLRGWAEPSLLDSYETERRPVAEYNVSRSADPNGSFRDAQQELHADLGGRIPHLWLPSKNGQVSTHDLLGLGLTLFIGSRAATWKEAAASVQSELPLQVRGLDVITARAMGIQADGALLAGPDGWPVATWTGGVEASAGLHAAICSVTRRASARVGRQVA